MNSQLSLYAHALRNYAKLLGPQGLAQILKVKLLGASPLHETQHTDCRFPFWLRLATSDVSTYEQVFFDGEYDFAVDGEPDSIIDAGANIGLASILFANRYPNAKVIAIEAERSNYELLKKNVEAYPNVVPVHAALWNRNETISLVDPGLGNWGFMTESASDAAGNDVPVVNAVDTVRALTVDAVMREFNLRHIDILKVDIEGAEKEVFDDSSEWIDDVTAIVAELHERMKPGCTRNFYCGTPGFDQEWHQGENVYLSRGGYLSPV